MKKFLFSLVSLFMGAVLFFLMIKLVGWRDIKNSFLSFSGVEAAITLFLGVLVFLLLVFRWGELVKAKGYRISFRELLAPCLSCFSIRYLLPMIFFGADIFKGYILKEKHNIPTNIGVSTAIIDRLLDLTFYILFSLVGIVVFFLNAKFLSRGIRATVFFMFFAISGFLVFFYVQSFRKKSFLKNFLKIKDTSLAAVVEKEVVAFFTEKKEYLPRLFLISFLKNLVDIFNVWVIALFLGKRIPFIWAFPLFGFSWLSMSPPISADIGSHDVASVFLFKAFGLGSGAGAAFAMVLRGINIFLSLFGILFLFKFGFDFLRASLAKKIGLFFNNSKPPS